jgi:RNA polymerase sigma-B factor
VAIDAHRDHVIPGVTGLLVDRTVDPRSLGRAIGSVLADPFGVRALGAAALVRVRAIHAQPLAGANLLVLLDEVRRSADRRATGMQPTIAGNSNVAPSTQEGTHGPPSLVMDHLHLARLLAGRYYGHGQSAEDLLQVAFLGLVLAAERFDPTRGTQFASFAIPTILGELRRYFRENAWAVRVPRSVQESTLEVQRASEELRQALGHDPTSADLAERLGRVEEDVLLAMRAEGEARSSHSLDFPVGDGGGFSDIAGELDPALDLAELRLDVRAALLRLPAREQRILLMRYYGERTQSEIAEDLGLSQVHVSRLLSRTLAVLHDHVLHDAPLPRHWVQPIAPIPSPRRGDQPLGAHSE